MRRRILIVTLGMFALLLVLSLWRTESTSAQQPKKAAPQADKPAAATLPIAQVILFNSGVGYFQREGDIEGKTQIDLSFPGSEINDLIKSLVLQDAGGGQISTIQYDSHDPIDKTLRSFALDLTANPTFGQLLNQARGEKVEVTLKQVNNSPVVVLTGVILGMETQPQTAPASDIDVLNLHSSEGIRGVPIKEVLRVKFANPALDDELKRALDVLASARDTQKKLVSLFFQGEGKRNVKVGYVVENPIWKTSYRLVFDAKGKPRLQGWAVVENTSDSDWKDVREGACQVPSTGFEVQEHDQ